MPRNFSSIQHTNTTSSEVFKISETLGRQAIEWRRDFHRNPELLFDVERTAGSVAELLRSFGCDQVVTCVGRSGVVAVVRGGIAPSSRTIGIRADMDALPILEVTGLPYASATVGRMHACGHDGHMAMLLGAVKHLAGTRAFPGTLVAIFQPAEEGGAGAKVMVEDGLFERFGVEEVYALHNMPGMEVGTFSLSDDVMLAASDRFDIKIIGKGGHAAQPHETIDPISVANHVVSALQTIVSRSVDPIDPVVLSITSIHAGDAYNVIPSEVVMKGTARSLSDTSRDKVESLAGALTSSVAKAFGAEAEFDYRRGYPPTVNYPRQAVILGNAAARVAGEAAVRRNTAPIMGAEDFSYMLRARPGAFIFMGNGMTAPLHNPKYDFNDEALPHGIALWVELLTRERG
ncbi:M20 aminoacylase family protein [Mesorhizobium humile]|uniref:M20 aminoacylase family protein n=1 Tax=Mesorhizobium humile TaxID=3072313 RepID=A0ABU4YRH3_9HYPH|nr:MULTISPECIES: M20 aminoacylase family protein [unclassified Mesorhizobium]MDX8463309.1 M20 aminoacylase family protein [Mesorhizobium sp. VK2D]MDX8488347.1 M20 aminoacylase family protein [Mesorhizobium sp. VK2B]